MQTYATKELSPQNNLHVSQFELPSLSQASNQNRYISHYWAEASNKSDDPNILVDSSQHMESIIYHWNGEVIMEDNLAECHWLQWYSLVDISYV